LDTPSQFLKTFLIAYLLLNSILGWGQQVANVPQAFDAISLEPEVILINNRIKVPHRNGHFQGVQHIIKNGAEKLLVSGSSRSKAYVLQIDLNSRTSESLIPLMKDPFRHAGGIQVSEPYLIVGIEDNIIKTTSRVCLYNYQNNELTNALPSITIGREGEPKRQTAGASGLLAMEDGFLSIVANWDSRNWDFYHIKPKSGKQQLLYSFTAPTEWGGYQAINLLKDHTSIYALGFYKKGSLATADLILVSKRGPFEPIMEKVDTKSFNCKNGADFNSAVGLQVNSKGKLVIWSTQADPAKKITINKFSQP